MLFGSDTNLIVVPELEAGLISLSPLPPYNCFPLAIEQDGVGMKHSTEAVQKGRVA
jgi:hypothetical protein